jgi:hypothetical protein
MKKENREPGYLLRGINWNTQDRHEEMFRNHSPATGSYWHDYEWHNVPNPVKRRLSNERIGAGKHDKEGHFYKQDIEPKHKDL